MYSELRKLREKTYFTLADLSETWNISPVSARVTCSRYVKKGLFIRLKNNFYILEENWRRFSKDNFLKITNFLQVPSYVSFMTALSIHEVTTQVQRNFYESACLTRSKRVNCQGVSFNFYKLKKELYSGFVKKDGIFIATPEKAFIDAIHLYAFNKYKLDFSSLDLNMMDRKRIQKILEPFPQRTKNIALQLCKS